MVSSGSDNVGYRAWDDQIQKIQQWASLRFEHYLREFFDSAGELKEYQPQLPSGRKPDFLIRDANGNTCYLDAKIYYSSREASAYYRQYLLNWLSRLEPVNGLCIDLNSLGEEHDSIPSGDEIDRLQNWLATIDRGRVLEAQAVGRQWLGGYPDLSRTFEFGGAHYEVEAVAFADGPHADRLLFTSIESGSYTISPDREYWLDKRIRRAAETYTEDQLAGTPLVVAALNFSDEHIGTEIYGVPFISFDKEARDVTDKGYTGMGLWRDTGGPKENVKHVHAVWLWERKSTDRPVLYTNPDVIDLSLPSSLFSYNYWISQGREEEKINLEFRNGEASDQDYTERLWLQYINRRCETRGDSPRFPHVRPFE